MELICRVSEGDSFTTRRMFYSSLWIYVHTAAKKSSRCSVIKNIFSNVLCCTNIRDLCIFIFLFGTLPLTNMIFAVKHPGNKILPRCSLFLIHFHLAPKTAASFALFSARVSSSIISLTFISLVWFPRSFSSSFICIYLMVA